MTKLYEAYFSNTDTVYEYFRREYHLITTDHEEKNFQTWIDRWIENFQKYYSAKIWTETDSAVAGGADTLEEMLRK